MENINLLTAAKKTRFSWVWLPAAKLGARLTCSSLTATLLVQFKQSAANQHRWAGAALPMAESVDGRLAARHEVSKLLFGQASPQEVGGDFLEVHDHTLSRTCLIYQHQCD